MTEPNSEYNQSEQYQGEEENLWINFRKELFILIDELQATQVELAEGLKISRQSLVLYLRTPSRGLPIKRSSILFLWDFLTDPDRLKDKNLSEETRLKRDELRNEGPNRLLIAAGFLPRDSQQFPQVSRSLYPYVLRIVAQLELFPFSPESNIFGELIDSIENEIRQRAFTNVEPPSKNRLKDKDWVENWVKKKLPYQQPKLDVLEKLKKAVYRFGISGKHQLYDSELFDLYTSISLNNFLTKKPQKFLAMRVVDCQLETLSFPLHNSTDNADAKAKYIKRIKELFSQVTVVVDAEQKLRGELHKVDGLYQKIPPVIKASIVCNFREQGNVRWEYCSASPQGENMLLAIQHGMGYESKLKLTDISIRALGIQVDTLVRVSVVFSECSNNSKGNTYHGLWVEQSFIFGVLQSVVVAAKGWLIENIPEESDQQKYYEICRDVAEIDADLAAGRKALNEWLIQPLPQAQITRKDVNANAYFDKIINKIPKIKTKLQALNPMFTDLYGLDLERKYYTAKLMRVRSALIEGDIKEAANLLYTSDYGIARYEPISVLYTVEDMIYQFFSGDRDLLGGKQWRYKLDICMENLLEYVKGEDDSGGSDRIDFYVYWSASEIFGNIARLDLYFGEEGDFKRLEKNTINYFLIAAYYSSQIGQKLRVAHWFVHISRTYSRLGDKDNAVEFAELAEKILDDSVEPRYYNDYLESIKAEVNLAKGELYLHSKEFDQSLEYFLNALKGAIYLGFARLIADSLYGIARVASKDNHKNVKLQKSFDKVFGEVKEIIIVPDSETQEPATKTQEPATKTQDMQLLDSTKQGWEKNTIAENIIKFLNGLKLYDTWGNSADKFKEESKKIWNDWFNKANLKEGEQGQHPVAKKIEDGSFLKPLSR
jgi:tetratricopeptide (TPR) repeat protein